MTADDDLLPVGAVAQRSGYAPSALRYYERLGLIASTRSAGNQRRYRRSVLRRLAFIRAARSVGLSLDEVATALDSLPDARTPTKADWARLSRRWRARLDQQIAALEALRSSLDQCIGCGCLSLRTCRIYNPEDALAAEGAGARRLPADLRREGIAEPPPSPRSDVPPGKHPSPDRRR